MYKIYGCGSFGYEELKTKQTEQEAIKYVYNSMTYREEYEKYLIVHKSKELGDSPVGLYFRDKIVKSKSKVLRKKK